MVSRTDKINELIREQISLVIYSYLPDEYFAVSNVTTSTDLSYCKVAVLTLNSNAKVIDFLNDHKKEIQSQLSAKIKLRKTPAVVFYLDKSEDEADKISKLLETI